MTIVRTHLKEKVTSSKIITSMSLFQVDTELLHPQDGLDTSHHYCQSLRALGMRLLCLADEGTSCQMFLVLMQLSSVVSLLDNFVFSSVLSCISNAVFMGGM